jgi:cytochrome b6-f complex iron-sulfur subunit
VTSLALSSAAVAAIVAVVVVDLFAILFGISFARARRAEREAGEAREAGEPAPKAPKPMSRREFFRRSLVTSFGIFSVQFGAATIAFLWPNLKGGFGSVIPAGNANDILNEIRSTNEPFYVGTGRFYLIAYEGTARDEAHGVDYSADEVVDGGLMALYQRCVHLGCRVPFCKSSQWFECPCHGSKYNYAGEYELGPAPTGLDRFKIRIEDGTVMVDTSEIVPGPPRGTDTINEPPQGPFCVAPG